MFQLTDKYDKRRSGLRGRITRLYNYQWTGAPKSARFDAGLVNVDGSARKAYKVFKRQAKKHARYEHPPVPAATCAAGTVAPTAGARASAATRRARRPAAAGRRPRSPR